MSDVGVRRGGEDPFSVIAVARSSVSATAQVARFEIVARGRVIAATRGAYGDAMRGIVRATLDGRASGPISIYETRDGCRRLWAEIR